MSEAALKAALRLFRSDSQEETYLAVAIVAVVALPVVVAYYRNTRSEARQ